ncbi:MAG: hypothetical protein LCH36_00340 [Actinobacteria bacterium]|nr:hypothetical protein [Actinomycetota bacterium]
MAGKGFEIHAALNASKFQKGVKDVEGALEEVADSLDDVAKEADKAGRKMGDEIQDGARDASQSVDRLERSFKDMADASKRETGRASDSMKRNTKEATTQAASDLQELGDEAKQNAAETFSSFDGSFESFIDGIQGTMGGIVSSMGAAGAVAGGALALGIGFAVAQGQELADAINTAKERAAELAGEILEADGDLASIQWADKFKEWGLAIEDSRQWFEFWQKDALTAFESASQAAEKFGVSAKDLSLGLSGIDADAATRSIAKLRDQIKELEVERGRAMQSQDRNDIKGEIHAREQLIKKLEEQGNVTAEAAAIAETMAEISAETAAADEAAAAATQRRTDAVSSLQGELDESVASYAKFIDAETGAVDPAKYIAAMQTRMEATGNFNTNLEQLAANTGLSFEAQQAILDQGVEFAPMLASIMAGGSEMQAQYAAQMEAMVTGGQAILDGTTPSVTVTATADSQDAERQLAATAEERTAPVKAEADTKTADATLDAAAAKTRTAKITASVDLTAAETALANFVNRRRTATVTVNAVDREGRALP